MFSGIVEGKACVISRNQWQFVLNNIFSDEQEKLAIWQSIAHDGACMTVTSIDDIDKTYWFFVMEESFSKTTLWMKQSWDMINVERCVRYGDRIDGHMVTGHVDTVWTVTEVTVRNDWSQQLVVSYDASFSNLIVSKWSIAINGVSLTVVDDHQWSLSVWLIPLTQELTNLWWLQLWGHVNLEFDMMAKYAMK